MDKLRVLVLSSSLLTDRVIIYSNFIKTLQANMDVTVWASSLKPNISKNVWDCFSNEATVESFPEIFSFKEFPHNYLRKLNDMIWDLKLKIPSRLSMRKYVREPNYNRTLLFLSYFARFLHYFHIEKSYERFLERMLINTNRSPEAVERLQKLKPDFIVTTNAFWYHETAIVAAAKKLKIPVFCYIPSWDNLSTKPRLVYKYDAYAIWSDEQKRQLNIYYPESCKLPVYVTGAPQYDIFKDKSYYISKEEFCSVYGLDPHKPIILYALGSPNFIKEENGVIEFLKKIDSLNIDCQVLVRAHPIHDNGKLLINNYEFKTKVVIQNLNSTSLKTADRSMDKNQITEWINTFKHSDILIHLGSTVGIDAAFFGKPIINIMFDPEIDQSQKEFIEEIMTKWVHLKPVMESGGMYNVRSYDEMVEAVSKYIINPSLHAEERERMKNFVAQYDDGLSSERLAQAIIDFSEKINTRALN